MTAYYVRSAAAGAGTGADWTNAYTTITLALSGKAAGDIFYVSDDHAESTGSAITLTFPGTAASPNFVYCVNRAGSVPPVSADLRTTGSIATTSGNITYLGVFYVYGLTFSASSGATTGTIGQGGNSDVIFDNCSLKLNNTSASSRFLFNQTTTNVARTVLNNTPLTFGATGQFVRLDANANFIWRNTPNAIGGATFPTAPFQGATGRGTLLFEGVDLSAFGSGITLYSATSSGSDKSITIKDCKLGASVTKSATPLGPSRISFIRCDSGATNYIQELYDYTGTLTTETTIVRTGGATDGTTPISWKVVTTANTRWTYPFECFPLTIWNETVGSAITLTVQGIWGGGAVPNNDDIWMDAEYLGSSATPIGSISLGSKADNLASGTAQAAGSGTWGGSTTKFTLTRTITPQMKGPVTLYIRAAAASQTFYVDPLVTVT